MKQLFWVFPLVLLLSGCFSRSLECEKFKTGTFQYETYADGEIIQAEIVRNDSLEIDYFDKNNPDTSKIRWINNCEYVLKKYKPKDATEKQSFRMQIIETEKNSYTFQFSQLGEKTTKEFTATRLTDDQKE